MNTYNIKALAIAVSLALSTGAMAQTLTKSEYQAGKDKISAEYQAARATCTSLSGNANDICVAEAKGQDKVALAALVTAYRPSAKNQYKLSVAKAEADYAVANERCDDKSGNVKDVCVKEAKAARIAAEADAKAQMKTAAANATASDESADARRKANATSAAARQDAAADKLEADYTLAKEKCETYAGGAKETCLDRAKTRFGKS